MSPRGKRTRFYDANGHKVIGIYPDDIGISFVAKVAGQPFERRLKDRARPQTPEELNELIALRLRWIEELTLKLPASKQGTLAGDIANYLTTLPPNSRRKQDARNSLDPWQESVGDVTRQSLSAVHIRSTLARWRADGTAASTLNHRRQELSNVYRTLNGKSGANPVRDVPRIPELRDEPRGIPPAIVALILAQVPEGLTRRRLEVIATTGLPHVQVGRLHPRDFHKARRELYVRPRRKGDGVAGRTLPLTKVATKALAAFFKAKAQGPFSNSSVHKMFRAAVVAARKQWQKTHRGKAWPAPDNLRPYDLRHAFLTEAYRRTRSLGAVAELALHADIRTTQRYVEAAVSETARKAIEQMDADE